MDRYEVQQEMLAGLKEAVRSSAARVRNLAEEAISLGSQIAVLEGGPAAKPAELGGGGQLIYDARDVILEDLLGDQPVPLNHQDEPADPERTEPDPDP